jgi:Cd2+/Zn2+-exporting ATPase
VILTGDNPRAAAAIAGELGLEFKAGLLPADKVSAVTELNAMRRWRWWATGSTMPRQ